MSFVLEWSLFCIQMTKIDQLSLRHYCLGTFHTRSETHAPLAPDYTVCDFQSGSKFVYSLHDTRMTFHTTATENWSELIPEWIVCEQQVLFWYCVDKYRENVWTWNEIVLEWKSFQCLVRLTPNFQVRLLPIMLRHRKKNWAFRKLRASKTKTSYM